MTASHLYDIFVLFLIKYFTSKLLTIITHRSVPSHSLLFIQPWIQVSVSWVSGKFYRENQNIGLSSWILSSLPYGILEQCKCSTIVKQKKLLAPKMVSTSLHASMCAILLLTYRPTCHIWKWKLCVYWGIPFAGIEFQAQCFWHASSEDASC